MAPLVVEDWDAFNRQLQQAKNIGVTAVSTDVWWGKAEGGADQQFDWSYYDKVSGAIIATGLKWVPILSFLQCGGNVGDTCDIPIPHWIWKLLGGNKSYRHMYKSEQGKFSREVIALWSDDKAKSQYFEFIRDFSEWYNHALVEYGELMIALAVEALGDSFPGTSLGIKIPSVHWLMGSPDLPRAAEVTAGLNPISIDITNDRGWDNIDNAVCWSAYRGLTTLRVDDLEANGGLGFHRYQQLINDFKP